ncbi:MAG: T9SS type A sorting domain-containing protein, partial [Bacteroidota bacterium]
VYINNGTLFVKDGKPANLEVYSVLGAKLKEVKNVNRLSMQDMQNGVYLIRVNNERAATKVVKF